MPSTSRRALCAAAFSLSIAAFAGSAADVVAQSRAAAQPYAASRTPWGDPDLQGIYTNSNESGIPMQRPAESPAGGWKT